MTSGQRCQQSLSDACIRNAAVFDPDTVYAYTYAMIEADHLCETDSQKPVTIVERVSGTSEYPLKTAKRSALTLAPWISGWHERTSKAGSDSGNGCADSDLRPLYLVAGELVNLLLYASVTLPPKTPETMFNREKVYGELQRSLSMALELDRIDVSKLTAPQILNSVVSELKKRNIVEELAREGRSTLERICSILGRDGSRLIALIQQGTGPFRAARVVESIEYLRELCGRLYGDDASSLDRRGWRWKAKAIFVLSEQVCREAKRHGELDRVIDKLRELSKSIDVELRSLAFGHGTGSRECGNLETIEVGELKDKNIICGNTVVLVFGDYGKQVLEGILKTVCQGCENGSAALMVVNEAFYAPNDQKEYCTSTYYGYLGAVKRAGRESCMVNDYALFASKILVVFPDSCKGKW